MFRLPFRVTRPSAAQVFAPACGVHGMVQFEDFFNVGLDEDFNDIVHTYEYAYESKGGNSINGGNQLVMLVR